MFRRLVKVFAFIVGVFLVIPCIIEWILIGRNTGMVMLEYAMEDD
jgi:hypothetical protein